MSEDIESWFNRIEYPSLDNTSDWINEIKTRLFLEVAKSSLGEKKFLLIEGFYNFLNDGEAIFNNLYKYEEIQRNHVPIRGVTPKELSVLSTLAATSPLIREEFNKAITVAAALSDSEITDQERAVSEILYYSQVESTIDAQTSEDNNLNKYDINDFVKPRLSLDTPHREFISVDLSCSNADLTKSFNHWLKMEREKYGLKVKKDISQQFDTWNKERVLATYDLRLWCSLQDIEITYGQQIEILFPNSDIDDDNYRKTIIPRMKRVINWNTLDQLKSSDYMLKKK